MADRTKREQILESGPDRGHDPEGDEKGSRYGMWLFLYTEIMFFGGLFVLYAAFLYRYADDFSASAKGLLTVVGAVNTVVLLVSSFGVASSITSVRKGSKKAALVFLSASVALGFIFLANKYYEWSHEIGRGIYPGSSELAQEGQGATVFFGLYFLITGLHALHVLVGITVLTFCIVFIMKNRISSARPVFLVNAGLFWHLVDVIWIFIFPLFYLLL